jgi:hypothetical protein
MRRVVGAAVLFLVMVGCDGSSPATGPVPVNDLCTRLVDAACARAARCKIEPTEPAACKALATDAFDGCPMAVSAVAMGGATYDAAAAETYIAAVRDAACTGSLPDAVATGVFTPQRSAGQSCHSKVSCKDGVVCEGSTVSTPAGVCGAAP